MLAEARGGREGAFTAVGGLTAVGLGALTTVGLTTVGLGHLTTVGLTAGGLTTVGLDQASTIGGPWFDQSAMA